MLIVASTASGILFLKFGRPTFCASLSLSQFQADALKFSANEPIWSLNQLMSCEKRFALSKGFAINALSFSAHSEGASCNDIDIAADRARSSKLAGKLLKQCKKK